MNYFHKIFPEISKVMNNYHNVNLSNDFWRIIIGPWFIKSIEYFHDKYIVLDALLKIKDIKLKHLIIKITILIIYMIYI